MAALGGQRRDVSMAEVALKTGSFFLLWSIIFVDVFFFFTSKNPGYFVVIFQPFGGIWDFPIPTTAQFIIGPPRFPISQPVRPCGCVPLALFEGKRCRLVVVLGLWSPGYYLDLYLDIQAMKPLR